LNRAPTSERSPISTGLLTGSLDNLSSVRLAGTRCHSCNETVFGTKDLCTNCGRDTVEALPLSDQGKIWSYTIVRHRPPGNYKGPEPFVPFGLGLVELPDGLRVLTPIKAAVDSLQIGMLVRLDISIRQEADGREVVIFGFRPDEQGRA
jgi:uncharacterized protein